MNRSRLALLSMVCGLTACSSGGDETGANNAAVAQIEPTPSANGAITLSSEQQTRLGIRFAPVTAASDLPIATIPATLAPPPNARVAVAAVIPGVVTRTLVVEGDSVRPGQPLAVIAAREMFTIAAAMEQASARAGIARANDRRLGQLARDGVIAGARADEAHAALREAEAELNEQRRIVRMVNGSPARGSYTLSAPIAGRIATASIQTGSPVSEATAAYVIDAVSRYELTAQLPERLIGKVRIGMAVRLPGDIRGQITSIGSVIDPQTRSATLRARIPAGPSVVSGRAVPATILARAPADAIAVPAGAVVEIDGKSSVFVRTDKGVAARSVEVGERADGRAVIRSGLRTGEQVAVAGMSELKSIAGQD